MLSSPRDVAMAIRRPAGAAAAAALVAGVVAAAAPVLPAWRLVARIEVTGTVDSVVVATLTGAGTGPVAWLATLAGLVAAIAAGTVAIDMPMPRAERVALGAAAALGAVAVVLALASPATQAFPGEPEAVASASLPRGVAIDHVVRPAWGTWAVGLAAAVVAGGTTTAVRRG